MNSQTKLGEYVKQVEQNLLTLHNLSYSYDCEEIRDAQHKLQLEEQLCAIMDKSDASIKALQVAQQADFESLPEIKRTYQTAVANEERKTKNYKLTKQYKDFEAYLNSIAITAEAAKNPSVASASNCVVTDEFVMESEINVIDPLTKKRMEYPVRNKLCGHNYERSSILEAIKLNNRLRCPVAGCGNKQHVRATHLVDDPEFKARLQTALTEMEEED